jgi:hypothetical protein
VGNAKIFATAGGDDLASLQSRRRAADPVTPSTSTLRPCKYESRAASSIFPHTHTSPHAARLPNPSRRAAIGANIQAAARPPSTPSSSAARKEADKCDCSQGMC